MTTATGVDVDENPLDDIVEQASDNVGNTRRWARWCHGTQSDKNGLPYVTHLDEVANNVRKIVRGFDVELIQAAYLHDILEDTAVMTDDLFDEAFSERTIYVVHAVTKIKNEPNYDYITRVIKAGPDAMIVKLADLYHNSQADRLAQLQAYTQERLREKYYSAIWRIEHALMLANFLLPEEGTISFDQAYDAVKVGDFTPTWSRRNPASIIKGDLVRFLYEDGSHGPEYTVLSRRVKANGAYAFELDVDGVAHETVLSYAEGGYESLLVTSSSSSSTPDHKTWQKRLGLPKGFKYGDPLPDYLEGEKV